MRFIFWDGDHRYFPDESRPNFIVKHDNLLIHENRRQLNFFDFGEAQLNYESPVDSSILERMIKEELEFMGKEFGLHNKNLILNIFKKKVETLIKLHSDFKGFKKIIERSGMKLTEKEERTLFDNITLRLHVLEKVLQ